jgi:hypothetical protein
VAGELQPQIDIHKDVSRLFCPSSFDGTTTELRLDAEKLIETVLHLNLGFLFVSLLAGFWVFVFCFFPFDETTTKLLLRHQHQDWRLKDYIKIIKTELNNFI